MRRATTKTAAVAAPVIQGQAPAAPNAPMTASVALPPPAILADDLLKGVKSIAKYTGLTERCVYHIAAAGRLPVFKMGATICARKSTILNWIAQQEAAQGGGGGLV